MLRTELEATHRDRIAEAAYFMWLQDGMIAGRDVVHWLQAERDVVEREVTECTIAECEMADRGPFAKATPVRKRLPKTENVAPRSVQIYRLKYVDLKGTVKLMLAVPAADDVEALIEAEHFRDSRRLEIWRGNELVGALPADASQSAAA